MKHSLKFAMGAALAGTLANLLVKRKSRDVANAPRTREALGAGPVESLNDSSGTPASAISIDRAGQPPPS